MLKKIIVTCYYYQLINLKMHIKTYLNEFKTFDNKSKHQLSNVFANLTQSKKEIKNSLHQKINTSQDHQYTSFKHFSKKHSDSAFDDQIFTALYKINRKLSYERYSTLSDKAQSSKLSFKLNYVENNYRPNIKQKIVSKLNHYINTKDKNQPKQQSKTPLQNSKKSKIESYITKNNDPAIIKYVINTNKQKSFSIKEKLIKSGQRNDNSKVVFEIDRYRTLSSRQVKSSFGNYDAKRLLDTKSPNVCLTPEKLKQKRSSRSDLPEYVQNIIKPCKIQGIELINRPSTTIGKRMSFRNGKLPNNQTPNKKFSFKTKDQDEQQQNIRTIKTARQGNRKLSKLNESRRQNPQRVLKNYKRIEFQPWGQQQQINLEQDQDILFSIE